MQPVALGRGATAAHRTLNPWILVRIRAPQPFFPQTHCNGKVNIMNKSNPKIDIVILAAGLGTRMKSSKPKVLHELMGKPMVSYILDAVKDLCADPAVIVVGNQADLVRETLGDRARYALQEPQLGTADAVKCAREMLQGRSDVVLVANSDFPLIKAETYRSLVEKHLSTGAVLTISTVVQADPRGFGRIVRDTNGKVCRIVEEKAASPAELAITEVNSNPYCFQADWLWKSLDKIKKSAVGEYYLTDLVELAYQEGSLVEAYEIEDAEESIGINNRINLADALRVAQKRINQHWMLEGVTMIDPERVYIESGVTLGRDTVLYPEVYLKGNTHIGENCELGPAAMVEDSEIGNFVKIKYAVLEKAKLEDHVDMGPFGHLRKGAHLGAHVHMGNFGEVKNSYLGEGTKMGHFSYMGDAQVGKNVNIGAGTITCNFDGEKKFTTEIGDDVFVGSDTMLVAPLKIGKGAKTGAGAVVTHDVEDGSVVVGVPARPHKKKEEQPGKASKE
jgi:bifunctional UDP-N-acetylglucosamine pyrophosphorylase/glucosamine-1-phosphate N-acetyltransferase